MVKNSYLVLCIIVVLSCFFFGCEKTTTRSTSGIGGTTVGKICDVYYEGQKTDSSVLYAKKYAEIIEKYAREKNLNPNLIKGVIMAESSFRVNLVSSAGARGLMQVIGEHFKNRGIPQAKWMDPDTNIDVGTSVLSDYMRIFKRCPRQLELGLASYNAGPRAVIKKGSSPCDGKIPRNGETEIYVPRVIEYCKRYQAKRETEIGPKLGVIIDPRFGGSDTGPVGNTGLTGKEVTLSIAQELSANLLAGGYFVILTRLTDKSVSDETRVKEANNFDPSGSKSIFISISVRESTDSQKSGVATYYVSTRGYKVAQKIHNSILTHVSCNNIGIKKVGKYEVGKYVLRKTTMPAIWIEVGYLSNEADETKLKRDSYRRDIANAIYKGIISIDLTEIQKP